MSIPKRNSPPSGIRAERTFLITSATWNHSNLLQVERYAALLCDVLIQNRNQNRFKLHAFVIMPDHFHALVTLNPEISVEKAAQFIKGGFSFRIKKELGRGGEVWQRGFSETLVVSADHFLRATDYIHQNPVRRGLCLLQAEYNFSTASGQYTVDLSPTRFALGG